MYISFALLIWIDESSLYVIHLSKVGLHLEKFYFLEKEAKEEVEEEEEKKEENLRRKGNKRENETICLFYDTWRSDLRLPRSTSSSSTDTH